MIILLLIQYFDKKKTCTLISTSKSLFHRSVLVFINVHKANAPYRAIVIRQQRLAEIAEHELKGFIEQSPSYIRDTTDFITKLRSVDERVPTDSIPFCFDVLKLYPSVPRKEGLQVCEEALSTRLRSLVSGKAVMEIIRTILDNNMFGFGDKSYIQKEGIAIGLRQGKKFACAYMRKWDEAPKCCVLEHRK